MSIYTHVFIFKKYYITDRRLVAFDRKLDLDDVLPYFLSFKQHALRLYRRGVDTRFRHSEYD